MTRPKGIGPEMFQLTPAHQRPMTAQAHDGEVVVFGPGTIAGAFTPEAARASAAALLRAADEAAQQIPPAA